MSDRNPTPALGIEIHKLNNLIRRNIEQIRQTYLPPDITGVQGWILGHIARHQDTPIYQKDIEHAFHIRRSTASKMLSDMEANGLLLRQSDPTDGRLKRLILTPRSLECHRQISAKLEEMERSLRSGLSESELQTLLSLLERVGENIASNT